MAYVNDFKRVVDNVAPQIEVLQKAMVLDPANTIEYQRDIDFCETIKLVEKDSKKTEDGQKKDSSETVEKPKSTKAKKEPKPAPAVEEPTKEENTSDDVFDMFGD